MGCEKSFLYKIRINPFSAGLLLFLVILGLSLSSTCVEGRIQRPIGKIIEDMVPPLLITNNNDTDHDGMPDEWEQQMGLDPSDSNDSVQDPDNDGLSNLQEYLHNLNPKNKDTDSDKMPDGWEVVYDLDPLINDADNDKDEDGLSNFREYLAETNPSNKDTDSDGFSDGDEKTWGTLPNWNISNPLTHLLFLIVVSSLVAGVSLLLLSSVDQVRMKRSIKKRFSTSTTPINLNSFAKKHKMTVTEIRNLTLGIKGEISKDFFYPAPFLIAKSQAPDYFLSIKVKNGNFPDYKTFLQAQELGADSFDQLELIHDLQAPDYAIAILVKEGHFPNYETYTKAQKLGAEKFKHLELIEKYQVDNYQSAVNLFKEEVLNDLLTTLRKEGRLVLKSFLKNFIDLEQFIPPITIASDASRMIEKERLQVIHTNDREVFLTHRYIRERLVEATRIYADLEFETLANALKIPVEHVHDVLVAAIQRNLILGMVDRINKRLFVREIPLSLFDQMLAGQMVSLKQIQQEHHQSLEISLKGLQDQIPSSQYVLTRDKEFVRIEQLRCGCQICGDKIVSEKFLKCEACSRELCWDHFIELGAVGRAFCPYCDGSLTFLPQFCEKCHIDYINTPRKKGFCDYCGYSLKVKDTILGFHQSFLEAKSRFIAKGRPDDFDEGKKN